jgi:hypothetical protein
MTSEDQFFTHTIVGQAFSIALGNNPATPLGSTEGLRANMLTGRKSLSRSWKEWCQLQGAYPYAGLPRRRPGTTRRMLERYALLIAISGFAMMLGSLVLLFVRLTA